MALVHGAAHVFAFLLAGVEIGVAVEEVEDGKAALRLFGVGGGQIDGDGLVGGVAEEVVLEAGGVDGGHDELGLRSGARGGSEWGGQKREREQKGVRTHAADFT